MDPLTLSLIAAGGQALGALPDIIPSEAEREQKKELEKLKRRQEQDALGLTTQERSAIEGQLQSKTQSQFDAAQAQRNRLLAGGMGVGGGDKLRADAAMAESQGRVAAEAAQAVEMADLQRARQEEQQIRDLQATQGEYARARSDAFASIPSAGVGAYVGQMAPEALLQAGMSEAGSFAADEMGVQMISQEFGLTPAQARTQLNYLKSNNTKLYNFYTNPETQSYMSMLRGNQ
jgi:hypothetical protein